MSYIGHNAVAGGLLKFVVLQVATQVYVSAYAFGFAYQRGAAATAYGDLLYRCAAQRRGAQQG